MLDRNSLIEKFVVMGIDSTKDTFTYNNIIEDQVHPTFLDIFPFEQQETSSYLDNFKLWCFPDGVSIYNENLQKINGSSKTNSQGLYQQQQQQSQFSESQSMNGGNIMSKNMLHHFVLTNQNTEKKYCSCLIIHEEVYIHVDDKSKGLASTIAAAQLQSSVSYNNNLMKLYVPKIICLVSNCPVLEFQKQFLAFVYKFTITSKLMKQPPKLKIHEHLYERFTSLLGSEGSFQKAEKMWDEEIYQQTLDDIKRQPEDEVIAKQFKLKEEYLVNFSISMLFRVHTLQNLCQKNSEIVFTLSNEEVCRLRPFSDQNDTFFILNNFSFRPLFEKISVKTTIALVQSILLERQILLISSNPNEIISICESLFTLIYPLKWACIYIPLLPIQLSEMISAMMPYIIGISKKNYEQIKSKIDHKDKVVIDLDNDTVIQTEIHKLPEYLCVYLTNNFKELFKKFYTTKTEEQKKKNAWVEVIFQLKKIFLNFMTCLINNLTPYFLYSNKFDKDNVASKDIFAKSDYLQIFESAEKSFMTEFCQNTMMFSKFLEDSYRILYVTEFKKEDIDLTSDDKEGLFFFLKNIKKIHKSLPKCNSEKKFDIIQNPLIFSALDYELTSQVEQAVIDYQNPTTIDLTPHLIKYLKFIENKTPEQTPNYPPGSAKQISASKAVFKKLEKEWLMPIPKPVINQPVVKKNNNKNNDNNNNNNYNEEDQQQINQQNFQSAHNRNSGEEQLQQKSLDNSVQQIRSSQQLSQISNNTFITPKENYKDPYFVNDQYQEPSIVQNPILFYRNVDLEYDSWHNRTFQQEFDKITLEFPLKRQIDISNQYKIFLPPATRPYVKNIEDMIYMQDALQRMLQQASIQKQHSQQQSYQQQQQYSKQQYYPSTNQQPHHQENTRGASQYSNNPPKINEDSLYYLKQNQNSLPYNPNKYYQHKSSNNLSNPAITQNNQNSQLPPLSSNYSEFNSVTHEDTLQSNRQSLAQQKMRHFLQAPPPLPLNSYQTNPQNNTSNNWNTGATTPTVQDHISLRNHANLPQQSQRSRQNSFDNATPFRQTDINTLQQNPQKYNSKLLPPSLDQKQQKPPAQFDQINTKPAHNMINNVNNTNNTNNSNNIDKNNQGNANNKRLSIFQSNQQQSNQQLASQKENLPRSMSNNENINLNNAPIQRNRWDENDQQKKNAYSNPRISQQQQQFGVQQQQENNGLVKNKIQTRQTSTRQRSIFN